MPDQDQFTKSTKKSRDAAASIQSALEGCSFDEARIAKFLDDLVQHSGGVSAMPAILTLLEEFRRDPLFAKCDQTNRCRKLEEVVRRNQQSELDLVLLRATQRQIIKGQLDQRTVLTRFVGDVILRYIVDSVVDADKYPEASLRQYPREDILRITDDVIRRTVDRFSSQPNAKHLRISLRFHKHEVSEYESVELGDAAKTPI